jgi:hypothetical protein
MLIIKVLILNLGLKLIKMHFPSLGVVMVVVIISTRGKVKVTYIYLKVTIKHCHSNKCKKGLKHSSNHLKYLSKS